ncbi:hypothetical protein [Thermovibrio sp.]
MAIKLRTIKLRKVFLFYLTLNFLLETAPSKSYPIVEYGVGRFGWEYKLLILRSFKPEVCQAFCLAEKRCASWRLEKEGAPKCYLISAIPEPVRAKGVMSGIKPAYYYPDMEIKEPWGKYFKVLISYPFRIPNTKQNFGWKEVAQDLGSASPPSPARGVLYLYPPNSEEPAVVVGKVKVPSKGKGEMIIRTAGNRNSSYRLVVKVNGNEVINEEIDGSRWWSVKVDLSKWKGKEVNVEVLGYPMGWFFNYIFLDKITVK